MTTRLIYYCLLTFLLTLLGGEHYCFAQSLCKADATHPIQICLDPTTAWTYRRCLKQVVPTFYIDVLGSKYRYSVRMVRGTNINDDDKVIYQSPNPDKWRDPDPLGIPPPSLQPISLLQQSTDSAISGTYTVQVVAAVQDATSPSGVVTTMKQQQLTIEDRRHVRSLIVGVSHYSLGAVVATSTKPITNLHFATNDAESFAKALKLFFSYGSDDYVEKKLLDADATTTAVNDAVKDVQDANTGVCSSDDLLIFYFSGHTFANTNETVRYVGTVDTDPKRLYRGLSYSVLLTALSEIHAGKLIVFDSCYSGYQMTAATVATRSATTAGKLQLYSDGAPAADAEPPPEDTQEILAEIGRLGRRHAFYSAAQVDHQAQEGVVVKVLPKGMQRHFLFTDEVKEITPDTVGHGLFTYLLLLAIKNSLPPSMPQPDLADDGSATAAHEDPASQPQPCIVDFNKAERTAQAYLDGFGISGRSLQTFYGTSDYDKYDLQCRSH